MSQCLERARDQLARRVPYPVVEVGLFERVGHVPYAAFGSIALGTAVVSGGVGGPLIASRLALQLAEADRASRALYRPLPRWALVVVTLADLRLVASDRRAGVGGQVVRWPAGTFSVIVSRLPFEVDLWIRPAGEKQFAALRARRRLLSHAAVRTVRAVAELAVPLAHGAGARG